ncbi:MAG: hypothetical protein ABJF23_27050 [Bryobacteraceae bacterium]
MAEHDFAVIVGIGNYGMFQRLPGVVEAAREFEEWLVWREGGDVPKSSIKLVISPENRTWRNPASAQPTVDNVDAAFRVAARRAFDRKSPRLGRLYIYLVGHGISPTLSAVPNLEDAALLMANADEATAGLHVPGQPYANWFRNAKAFEEIVLFMDCCRDNRPEVAPRLPPFPRRVHPDANAVRYTYAYSTQFFVKSYVRSVGSSGSRPVFSFALLEGLKGAARREGKITASTLRAYVNNRLSDFLQAEAQCPVFSIQSDLEFGGREPATSAMADVRMPVVPAGQLELLDSKLEVIARLESGASIKLPRGFYKVSGGPEPLYFEVRGYAGEQVKVRST